MGEGDFSSFFRRATGAAPFPYQVELALAPELPQVLHVATGAGKTAAAILGWLWRRCAHPDAAVRRGTPRRLVYCLPMRVLVEQTHTAAALWLERLGLRNQVGLHMLLGGAVDDDWLLRPEQEAILIGTQDLLLSRALGRGYGLSRFRWPVAFGLLNSDCLWVADEVQLLGAGLATTVQLDAFRTRFGTAGPVHTLWMSATLSPGWLETVDRPAPPPGAVLRLAAADLADPRLRTRLEADKRLFALAAGSLRDRAYPRRLAAAVREVHRPETLTLVVLNTVERAQALFRELQRGRGAGPGLLLLHSRFRGRERQEQQAALAAPLPPAGRIAVATQVVEAGVDLDARQLITELAPWPSLVQRLGRCNRRGEAPGARVLWVDVEDRAAAPYDPGELARAREILGTLEGQPVCPAALPQIDLDPPDGEVLRARDLLDLFDTAPDLSGNDVDVSRFIRAAGDPDVQVFWRHWEQGAPPDPELPAPGREELCPVPVYQFKEYLRQGRPAWVWDHLDEGWRPLRADALRPGLLILLPAAAGGYRRELGWDPAATDPVPPVAPAADLAPPEGVRDDHPTFSGAWQTLAAHTEAVVAALAALLSRLPAAAPWRPALELAARWHDAGKAHTEFQHTMRAAGPPGQDPAVIWAKSGGDRRRHRRRHFRHELASLLAFLQVAPAAPGPQLDLAAYLVASHHGRVRLAIRSLPGEAAPPRPGARHALGGLGGRPAPARRPGRRRDPAAPAAGQPRLHGPGAGARRTAHLVGADPGPAGQPGPGPLPPGPAGSLPAGRRCPGQRRGGDTMTQQAVILAGCTPEPLAGYLKALGVLRLVALHPEADPQARGHWQREGFCLLSRLDRAALVEFFLHTYRPTPVLAPWNGGSGFWDRTAAGRALARVRQSTSPRLTPYREAIAAATAALAALGLAGRGKPRDEDKERLLRALRARLPDGALPWLDATTVLAADAPRFAPILGTGGNDGRLDFTANFMQRLELVLPFAQGAALPAQSRAWLEAALFQAGAPPLVAASTGQYNPGGVGGPNATRGLEGSALVNPWDYILLMEGAMAFAGAAARRLGSLGGPRAAFPFTVEAAPVGTGTLAPGEMAAARAEIWVPLWDKPATYAAVQHLLGEGRAQAGRRQARSGVDFSRAVAGLGVDRGIHSFQRYGILRRNGLAYLAAPLGRFAVQAREHVHLIEDLDPWLEEWRRFVRGDAVPERLHRVLRGLEAAIFAYCAEGGPRALQEVLAAAGRAERALAASPKQQRPRPLQNLSPGWLTACDDGTPEFHLAAALAGIDDPEVGPLRCQLEPVQEQGRRVAWAPGGSAVPWAEANLAASLVALLERRLILAGRAGLERVPVAGRRRAPLAAVQAFLGGGLDEERLGDLLWALVAVRGPLATTAAPGPVHPSVPAGLNRAYALLKLLFWPEPLRLPGHAGAIHLRAEPAILQHLRAARLTTALATACRRLWASGLVPLGWARSPRRQPPAYTPPAGGTLRLAGALLIPVAGLPVLSRLVLRPPEKEEEW